MFLLSHYYVHQTLLGAGHTAEDKKKKKKDKNLCLYSDPGAHIIMKSRQENESMDKMTKYEPKNNSNNE